MRLVMPGCYPISFYCDTVHWKRNGTHHGPQSNPRLIAVRYVRLGATNPPSSGRRLWIYVRGGYALHFDIYVDRRPLKVCAQCGATSVPR